MNMILCGLPMCGKTTVGKRLAHQLKLNFIDTDQLIEKDYFAKTGSSISCREIFNKEGEAAFRELEKQQLKALKRHSQSIIALGGGSLLDPDNRSHLQQLGLLIYLQTSIPVLLQRMNNRGTPAYLDGAELEEAFKKMAEERLPFYKATAHLTIETSELSLDEIVNKIICKVKNGQ